MGYSKRTINIMKNKKAIKRVDKMELAIEAMRKATSQFEEASCEIYTEDLGDLHVAYYPDDQGFYISANGLENGWNLSLEDFTIKLIENLCSDGNLADCSTSLAEALRESAASIELFKEEYLARFNQPRNTKI